jgi:hypothetical protein
MGDTSKNWMGLTSLILGIVAVVMCWCYGVGAVPGVIAIVFGVQAKKAVAQGQATNPGMAKAGFILGISGTIISIVWLVVMIIILGISYSGN